MWPTILKNMYMKKYTLQLTHVILCTVKLCDAAYIITNVEAKWPGSVHDSRIYRECSPEQQICTW